MTSRFNLWQRARNIFHGQSIRSKLVLIVVFSSSLAMLLTASGFVTYEMLNFRSALISEMSSVAEVLGAASRAPLNFRDRHVADENLSSLRVDKRITQVYLYDAENRFFTRYQRVASPSAPIIGRAHDKGEYFSASSLVVFRPIFLDGDLIGTIALEVSLEALYARIWRYFAIVCLVLVVSLPCALVLAVPLQRVISDPIHELAETARRFTAIASPGLRAVKQPCNAHDEIGLLIDSFNNMLAKVEDSSAALKLHGSILEETVSARTAELTAVNGELKDELEARQVVQEALRKSEERYALAMGGANDGLWDWDLVTHKIYLSPRWKSMLGCCDDEIGDQASDWLNRIHPMDINRVRTDLAAHCSGKTHEFESEYRILHKDGAYRWVLTRGLAVRGPDLIATRLTGSQTDVTQNKVSDALTGLPNRILFTDRVVRAIANSKRDPSRAYAVLFLDLDRFKLVNDSFGHLAGDQLLIGVAQRLRSSLHDCESAPCHASVWTVARLGGDEFAILLENPNAPEQATAVAEAILESLRPPFLFENREIFSGASIGVALGNMAYFQPDEVLRDADTAMYVAKSKGKAQWAVFDGNMGAQAKARLELERDLRHAIERQELFLEYQPIVLLGTGQLTGFEALLRWRHPERGLVSPMQFIPIAEETGLIGPIGLWVLGAACRQMSFWNAEYPGEPRRICINLSGKQLIPGELTLQVAAVLAGSGLDPHCLQLEVTESILMKDTPTVVAILEEFKSTGIGLSIDDFGTGYSSLSYLHRLPFDTLKIDRSFVEGMGVNKESLAIVKTILNLAESLGMDVVAEGIEYERQWDELQALSCSHGQGYYISRPLSATAAQAFLEASHRTAGDADMVPSQWSTLRDGSDTDSPSLVPPGTQLRNLFNALESGYTAKIQK